MSSQNSPNQRTQWLLSGLVVTALAGIVGLVLHLLLDWPPVPWGGLLVGIIAIPTAVGLGRSSRLASSAQAVLVQVLVVGGLIVLVGGIYILVVVGLNGVPEGSERTILALSMCAAAVAALLASPARRWLTEWANQRVYGEVYSPDDALKTFGGRMSRAVPMDELILQLVETLKKTMGLSQAEVWTGGGGLLNLAASVPDRVVDPIRLDEKELTVASRAQAQGNSWLEIWIPQLLEGRENAVVRSVSVAHLGELLGLVVLTRSGEGPAFSEEEDAALVELARQLGLALHNVSLDSALQASLDELAERNKELVASRARIVAAADESRRGIERDLHDGAQQHLVALAVKVGLTKSLIDDDPETAVGLLEELRADVQTTLTELRELAHGIYPPLLMERGLAEALQTVANRAVLPTEIKAPTVGRFEPDLEAAVYFCCVEAVQNAGKYAGHGATITVRVGAVEDSLWFAVEDDGVGFEPKIAEKGHGFVNMADRLGAFGGSLEVQSEAGAGATIRGVIPLEGSDPRE